MSSGGDDNDEDGTTTDEWVFSVFVKGGITGVVSSKTDKIVWSPSPSAAGRSTKNETSSSSSSSSSPGLPETTALLEESEGADSAGTHSPGPSFSGQSRSGWTFEGPFWKLHSKTLLSLTYRPAWQALPEYTSLTVRRDYLQRACTCKRSKKRVDFFTVTYTSEDIVETKELPADFTVRGVGRCRGIRIFLRGDSMKQENLPPVPSTTIHESLSKQWNLDDHYDPRGEWDRIGAPTDSLAMSDDDDEPHASGPFLTFAMPCKLDEDDDHDVDKHGTPPLLWKLHLPPNPDVALETLSVLDGGLTTSDSKTKHKSGKSHDPTHIYVNGYQSWSFTGSVAKGAPQPMSAMPDLYSGAFNQGGSPPPPRTRASVLSTTSSSYFSPLSPSTNRGSKSKSSSYISDFFTCITSSSSGGQREGCTESNVTPSHLRAPSSTHLLDETGGPALVLGWLGQHHQLGVVTVDSNLRDIQMHASCDNQISRKPIEMDWAFAQLVDAHSESCGYDEEPMVHYLHAVASYNVARPLQNGPLLTGWCSWYHYYSDIDAARLKDNFGVLRNMHRKIPTNVAVVDDGYMTAWGDWESLKPGKFPNGLGGVAQDIVDCGMRPGLWLAPFACDKHSKIYEQHPDWIIYAETGRPANSSNCGKFFYGLDATNPHVREHVFGVVRRAVQDWGYKVLKIDFLYAACLEGNGKYDLGMSRAQTMTLALQTIRAAAGPDVFLIGCGCPIGPGIGYADGMRISADTGPTWLAAFPLPYWDHGTLPSLRAMIRNSMSRAPFGHRWWHNDPDCLLLGETTYLTSIEVASAASVIAMTCGMLLLSDDLTKVGVERMRIATKIFPMTGATAVVLDLHSTTDSGGMPSLLRLWCSDKFRPAEWNDIVAEKKDGDKHRRSTLLGRHASFSPDEPAKSPSDRERNCVHVVDGLGTWTLLSVSNWTSKATTMHIPYRALVPHPEHGWHVGDPDDSSNLICQDGLHVFKFWSGTYEWIPDPRQDQRHQDFTLQHHLLSHQTEIFHIKRVQPGLPEYIGSDIHFSCGYEVRCLEATRESLVVKLRQEYNRVGHVYLFLPIPKVKEISVRVGGKIGEYVPVGTTPSVLDTTKCIGRVIRVFVVVHGDGSDKDGEIEVKF